jgi:cytochrome c oxidase cbb3-type subunit 4
VIDPIINALRAFWGVWVMVFFCGIVLWAYWPKNKASIEAHGRIPLQDDENEER